MAARLRWVIRWAPPADGWSPPRSTSSSRRRAATRCARCASASARELRWSSNGSEMFRTLVRAASALCLMALSALAVAQAAPPPIALSVITFDGGWNLPLWAAQRQGFFEANGVTVQLSYTPSSAALITGLFAGRYQIALATLD